MKQIIMNTMVAIILVIFLDTPNKLKIDNKKELIKIVNKNII